MSKHYAYRCSKCKKEKPRVLTRAVQYCACGGVFKEVVIDETEIAQADNYKQRLYAKQAESVKALIVQLFRTYGDTPAEMALEQLGYIKQSEIGPEHVPEVVIEWIIDAHRDEIIEGFLENYVPEREER